MRFLTKCVHIREISYLKSFKVQQDDTEDESEDTFESEDEHDDPPSQQAKRKRRYSRGADHPKRFASETVNSKSYFHYIKFAIQNATNQSKHVNMRPCYGFDITPSSGHLLDDKSNIDFIETSLPRITPPSNDFHINLLNAINDDEED
jgi:hypothetical protein